MKRLKLKGEIQHSTSTINLLVIHFSLKKTKIKCLYKMYVKGDQILIIFCLSLCNNELSQMFTGLYMTWLMIESLMLQKFILTRVLSYLEWSSKSLMFKNSLIWTLFHLGERTLVNESGVWFIAMDLSRCSTCHYRNTIWFHIWVHLLGKIVTRLATKLTSP
jgi:hypothetical protein